MNILGLVFSLLLILGYGFYASWEKHAGTMRVRSTYLGHERAHRQILCKYQSEIYDNLGSKSKSGGPKKNSDAKKPRSQPAPTPAPDPNAHCSKLNLWPLIAEGKEEHPFLYQTAAKLLRTFYGKRLLGKGKKSEYALLDSLLAAAQKEKAPQLEKLHLDEAILYYKMLKGTKEWDVEKQKGYPPLLDYIKIEPTKEKLCLSHAHPDLLTTLFNKAAAAKLYQELHREAAPPLTQELIKHLCSEAHLSAIDPQLFDLLEFGHSFHEQLQKTFTAEDEETQVSLRQTLPLKS